MARIKNRLDWTPKHAHDWLQRGLEAPVDGAWKWALHDALDLADRRGYPPGFPLPALGIDKPTVTVSTDPTVFWVTKDMNRLAFNAWDAASAEELNDILGSFTPPCPHAIVLFEEPLGKAAVGSETVPIVGAEWAELKGRTWIRPLLRFTHPHPYTANTPNCVLPLNTLNTLNIRLLRDEAAGVISWLGEHMVLVANLMTTPTVAERSPLLAGGRTGHVAAKAGNPIPEVNVLRLRPMRYEQADTDGRGHAYKHRFVVSGHWRKQPYGEGRKKRRRIWVNPYIKGPEGAPLLNQKKVYVWAR